MTYFEWAEDMSIDEGGPIDEDHKLLVAQVNELHTATSQGEGRRVVRDLLYQVISSTQEHTAREEAVMAGLAYPRLAEHQREHHEFTERLCELARQVEDGRITVAAQLSALLRDWLSLHIRRYDRDFLAFRHKQEQVRVRAMRAAAKSSRQPSRAADRQRRVRRATATTHTLAPGR